MNLHDIREKEKLSHIEVYSHHDLYADGSWLKKPVKTVLDLLPYFQGYSQINVLDLGSGVGRNSIAVAKYFNSVKCHIDCVDILDFAISKLHENAEKFGVSNAIQGIVCPIEDYHIPEAYYDLVLSISALEHINSKEAFIQKLKEIKNGIRENGIVCLIISTEITEICKESGTEVPAQFEVNLSSSELQNLLADIFNGWNILKHTQQHQQYDIPREDGIVDLQTNVITLVARK